eukprot:TRINITY_DN23556_c0_g1_i1.p1 TRINITY_DN23556_c0_g1~~TRINITY_DN23556_c0_g1_i1.p1  ORF type:complete len:788 (+),score=152.45 TRINITY_DN23556_c0_g1_i1:162-2366(+)
MPALRPPLPQEATPRGMPSSSRSPPSLFARRQMQRTKLQQPLPLREPISIDTLEEAREDAEPDLLLNDTFYQSRAFQVPTPPRWVPPWAGAARESQDRLMPPSPLASPISSSPLVRRLRQRGREGGQMLSNILNGLLPLPKASGSSGTPKASASPRTPRRLGLAQRLPQAVRGASTDSCVSTPQATPLAGSQCVSGEDEVVVFRAALTRGFGNVTRAFRAMKNAVLMSMPHSPQAVARRSDPMGRLTKDEFEWCYASFLHLGGRKTGARLFAALDTRGLGEVGLAELNKSSAEELTSLVELRRSLLERYTSVQHAFRELEDLLRLRNQKSLEAAKTPRSSLQVSRQQFAEASSLFGLEPYQALHLFTLLDKSGDGSLTTAEFCEALVDMPREVLLEDLRQRLLSRHTTIADAFRGLCVPGVPGQDSASGCLKQRAFVHCMAALRVAEFEALELFKILDSDNSGSVSVEELREALREVAPATSLEGFWQRVAAEWPEVAEAARECSEPQGGLSARQRLGELLAELLPEELREQFEAPGARSIAAGQVSEQGRGVSPVPVVSLRSVTLETFDALSAHLDISRPNARELFFRVLESAAPSSRRSDAATPESSVSLSTEASSSFFKLPRDEVKSGGYANTPHQQEIFIEDFAEQLKLWTQSLGGKQRPCDSVRQAVAPARAAISALKAELSASDELPTPVISQESPPKPRPPASKKKAPKLPWRAYYSMPNPTPVFVG